MTTLACLGTLAVAHEARAAQYGELHISSNTTLTDDRFGDIVFDADNIALDCANHQVHISSFTKVNGDYKAAIYADTRSGITIRNCKIVGGFDAGLLIRNSSHVTVQGVTSSRSVFFQGNFSTLATNLNLSGFIAIFIENDAAGRYSANIACDTDGIHVDDSSFTTISNTTISGCEFEAIIGTGNTGLLIDNVKEDSSLIGITMSGDSTDTIRNSVFNSNATTGIELIDGGHCSITNNTALGNAHCDANQESSLLNSWSGNTLGSICGTVPLLH